MKIGNLKWMLAVLLMSAVLWTSCGGGQDDAPAQDGQEQSDAHDHEHDNHYDGDPGMENDSGVDDMSGPEYTSAYICPMYCEGSGSDAPGKCPVCGMDYVAKAELKTDQE